MLCSVMLCHARVLLCHIMLCHVVFCRVCRGREAGYPGSSGQLGVWRPRYAGWGWPGSLFLKSNNPNLSGGEKTAKHISQIICRGGGFGLPATIRGRLGEWRTEIDSWTQRERNIHSIGIEPLVARQPNANVTTP